MSQLPATQDSTQPGQVSGNRLPNPIPTLLVLAGLGVGAGVFGPLLPSGAGLLGLVGSVVAGAVAASSVRIAAQWERGIVFRFGKYVGSRGPGVFLLVPFVDAVKVIDTRITTMRIPHRQAITKDNVPLTLDGVIFMRVMDPSMAVTRVQDYQRAVQEYAQTTLRDVVGAMTLDQILADREQLGGRVQEIVEKEIEGWGIDVAAIRIQDIELPEDLKRVMAREASAEREKRATITKAQGDAEAAFNLAAAAREMAASPGALQLRTLQSLDSLGTSASNTVVLALPVELTNALAAVPGLAKAIAPPTPKPEAADQ